MCGDGGFLMKLEELETAVRLRLPIIVSLWCDADFGLISLKQLEEFGGIRLPSSQSIFC